MKKIALQTRIKELKNAIAWSHEKGGLSRGMRICCHQECAASLKKIAAIENDSPYQGIPTYEIPTHIEERVQHILGVIKDTNWEKQECKY